MTDKEIPLKIPQDIYDNLIEAIKLTAYKYQGSNKLRMKLIETLNEFIIANT